jgi:preprotein translocase subunit SecD
MKTLIALIAVCLVAWAADAADSSAPPVFQIRLVLDAPSGDSEQMTIVSQVRKEAVDVQKTVLLDQTALKSAQVTTEKSSREPRIEIVFTDSGRKQFAEVTRQNIGKRLAIVIHGRLYCTPTIRAEIPGGKAEISGDFSEQEAKNLAAKITEATKKR